MILAGALGVLLTLSLLRSADHTRPVLVAAHDLAPGAVVDDASVRLARVHADASVLATLWLGEQLPVVRGQVVTAVVRRGQLLGRDVVARADARSSRRVMSFPIARARAVGGRLTAGDRVDVLAVDRDSRTARYVLGDAEVVAVEGRGGGALSGTSDDVTVTLVVDATTAPLLASALDAGTVALVRSTGAPPLQPASSPTTAGGASR
jgi:Flp pilus assembly protein CpaB